MKSKVKLVFILLILLIVAVDSLCVHASTQKKKVTFPSSEQQSRSEIIELPRNAKITKVEVDNGQVSCTPAGNDKYIIDVWGGDAISEPYSYYDWEIISEELLCHIIFDNYSEALEWLNNDDYKNSMWVTYYGARIHCYQIIDETTV